MFGLDSDNSKLPSSPEPCGGGDSRRRPARTVGILFDKQEIEREISYLCGLFGSILECRFEPMFSGAGTETYDNAVLISYTNASTPIGRRSKIRIQPDIDFWNRYLRRLPPRMIRHTRSDRADIFSSVKHLRAPLVLDNRIETATDLFGTAFFLASRLEEVFTKERDAHGRYSLAQSISRDSIAMPVVNLLAIELAGLIEEAYNITIPLRDSRMTAVITHDIDIPFFYRTPFAQISEFVNEYRQLKTSIGRTFMEFISCSAGIAPDEFDTFEYILRNECARGIHATFFLLLSRDTRWGLNIRRYRKRTKQLLGAGNELALHPGYHSHSDQNALQGEMQFFTNLTGITTAGVRNHFLRFKFPRTFEVQQNLKFLYDSTLGYNEHEGFRCGMANPFKPFDPVRRTVFNLIEIPLTLMDVSLKGRGVPAADAFEIIRSQIDTVASVRGTVVFNWHNTFLTSKRNDWRKVYEQSLAYLADKAEFKTCRQVAEEWARRWP